MGVPATTGRLCKTLAEMEIGDYIRCTYTADTENTAGEFSDLGGFVDTYTAVETVTDENGNQAQVEVEKTYEELPSAPDTTAIGFFYFIKVAKGLCVADRMAQHSISFQAVNDHNYVYGEKFSDNGLIRILNYEEYLKYLGEGGLNGNTTPNNNIVWNARKSSIFGSSFYADPGYGEYIMAEMTQSLSASQTRTIFALNGEGYDGNYHVAQHSAYQSNVFIYLPRWLTSVGSYGSVSAYRTSIAGYLSFRPALEYIDNPKSQTIWY